MRRQTIPGGVIEAALAHVVRNRVEADYAGSDLFERRRVLMDDWARYLAQGSLEDPEPMELRPVDPGKGEEVPIEAALVCWCRLGFTDAPGMRDRCRLGGSGKAGVRAWGPWAVEDGGVAVVGGGGRGRHRRRSTGPAV